jgi:hypothetical protein
MVDVSTHPILPWVTDFSTPYGNVLARASGLARKREG